MAKSRKHRFHGLRGLCLVLLVLAIYGGWVLSRPIPVLKPTVTAAQLQVQTTANNLAWPASGQSAVGYVGSDVLLTHGTQKPVPIASTAKILTALSVLSKKPLKLGEQGPLLTLSASDVALYQSYAAQDGSVVPVAAGEQISEYQVLQTMLLPSANNMADSLAIWAFGSLPNYTSYANSYTKHLGLTNTHVGSDASGFSPSTTANAVDLVALGKAAMQNPVLAQIVGQSSATGIPLAGTVKNVNFVLGDYGINGIKTGNTDQAGGVFIAASQATMNGHTMTVVTALAGSPTLFQALHDSLPLMQSAQTNVVSSTLINEGAVVGDYKQPWGGSVQAVAADRLTVTALGGDKLPATIQLQPVPSTSPAGHTVGVIDSQPSQLSSPQSVPVVLKQAPTQPSKLWRLLHPRF